MIQIDGKRVIAWLREHASPAEAALLIGSEFSDDFDEFELIAGSTQGFVCVNVADKKEKILTYSALALGTFFASDNTGLILEEKIRSKQTAADRSMDEAITHVTQLGFTTSTLGGGLTTLKLSQLFKNTAPGDTNQVSQDTFIELHEILEKCDHHNIRIGLKYLVVWLKQLEDSHEAPSFYDLGLRSRISSLFRTIGDVRAALGLSDFLDGNVRWIGSKSGEQYLRVSRAAALMDGVERRLFTKPQEIFPSIRKNLQIAHAISGGQSEYTLQCFNRLNALEKQMAHTAL